MNLLLLVPAVYDLEVAFEKGKEPNLTRMLMGEGGDVHLWIRYLTSILYDNANFQCSSTFIYTDCYTGYRVGPIQ